MFPLNNTFYIVWTMFCTKFFGRVYWMLYYWFRLFCHANKSHRNSYGESESIQTNKNYFMRLKFFSFRVWFVCATALQRCIAIKYNAILYYVEIRKQIDSRLFFFGGNRLNWVFRCMRVFFVLWCQRSVWLQFGVNVTRTIHELEACHHFRHRIACWNTIKSI